LVSGGTSLRAWSVGCASGEEAYTLMLIWRLAVAAPPGVELRILGTDVGAEVLARGAQACYPAGSIKLLPAAWVTRAFVPRAKQFCLREEFRRDVGWLQQDVRRALPDRSFHLIACRNLAFTYFEPTLQLETLRRLLARLVPGGALVIGHRESLPAGDFGLHPWPGAERLGVFRREPTP
jgi:chemotaxis protein methyltransferase CheR